MSSLAFITSRLRVEEKLLLQALEARGATPERVDDGALRLSLTDAGAPWPLVWNRSLAFGRTLYATADGRCSRRVSRYRSCRSPPPAG